MAVRFTDLQPVLAHVARHLDGDVSLEALSEHAGISSFHLQRRFAAAMGETPKQLAVRLRLERAAGLLLTRENSILEIALDCGFQSHEVFLRAFRRRFGMTPRAYRTRGFAGGVDEAQARLHAELVDEVGPCIGIYRRCQKGVITNDMAYEVKKLTLDPQPVLVVRRRVKRSEIAATIGEVLPKVFQFAQQNGIAIAGHPLTRYIEVGAGLITLEPGMRIAGPVDPAVTGDSEVKVDTLPGGPAATTMHCGPYDNLPEAYAELERWMEEQGAMRGGAPWEVYITDPGDYPDPKDWRTEVYWPLEG